ncbi:MAG: hypothetical protein RL637_281 [Pseudomonadota bacterium]
MNIDNIDRQLLSFVQQGLPIIPNPYLAIAEQLAISETEVFQRLTELLENGIIKRFGVIVHHRPLGYCANAMIVWNIADHLIDQIGQQFSREAFINLCYQRPRRANWNYNLYCMIHGKSKSQVLAQIEQLIDNYQLTDIDYQILFSEQCFKQRGAIYTFRSYPK